MFLPQLILDRMRTARRCGVPFYGELRGKFCGPRIGQADDVRPIPLLVLRPIGRSGPTKVPISPALRAFFPYPESRVNRALRRRAAPQSPAGSAICVECYAIAERARRASLDSPEPL
jgi:hypothetical protein